MGKATKRKQAKLAEQQREFRQSLGRRTSHYRGEDPFFQRVTHIVKEFSEDMIRSPEDWACSKKSPQSRVHYYTRHLFANYPVPGFFDQLWTNNDYPREFRYWFIAVGQGVSFYKKCAKPYMTRKATHLFLERGRKNLSIYENIWLARALAEHADPNFAVLWAKVNAQIAKRLNDKFWISAFKFFLKNPIKKGNKLKDVTDFLIDKHEDDETFTLKGRTLKSVIQLSDNWHADMARIKKDGSGNWLGLDIPDWSRKYGKDNKERIYSIKQIKTGKELSKEGNAMRHCIYGYKNRCMQGDVGIFSMRKTTYETGRQAFATRRCLTIEVSKYNKVIQARGYANRFVTPQEDSVLRNWGKEVGVRVNRYW